MKESKTQIYKKMVKLVNKYKFLENCDKKIDLFKLTSIHEIVAHATKLEGNWKRIIGVYFLFRVLPITNRLELIYVGQSTNIVSRIGTHVETRNFDYVYYIECPINLLDQLERRYIHILHPRDNIQVHMYKGD